MATTSEMLLRVVLALEAIAGLPPIPPGTGFVPSDGPREKEIKRLRLNTALETHKNGGL
jgi:hypothetical protein